ncbi:hypothetical protein [Rhodoplanes sp. Z2-YC6860]|uniref:hypothetical protein n=1 Tax=Rhodoplanes sp. Z2-YC6860 TaxID=674703 RepID=UPI0008327A45|nr:hypothetical protein [Rhodoplanes sp. Z2-YC6860]
MDLANMRQNGVRSIDVHCSDCSHHAIKNLDNFPGHLAVKSFERRMRCTQCGSRRIDVRPNWLEKPAMPSLTGVRFPKG